MIPTMVTNRMAALSHLLHHFGMAFGCLAYHEKGGSRVMFSQNLDQLGRKLRMWPIIKGECRHVFLRCYVGDRPYSFAKGSAQYFAQDPRSMHCSLPVEKKLSHRQDGDNPNPVDNGLIRNTPFN
jgi:hypothetical protein